MDRRLDTGNEKSHRNVKPDAIKMFERPKPPVMDRQAAHYNDRRAAFELALHECSEAVVSDERGAFWAKFERMLDLAKPVMATDSAGIAGLMPAAPKCVGRPPKVQMIQIDDELPAVLVSPLPPTQRETRLKAKAKAKAGK